MGAEELSTVEVKDVRTLVYFAQQDVRGSSAGAQTPDAILRGLRSVRRLLFAAPRSGSNARDALLGKNMRGRELKSFLRLAVHLGCDSLVVETFRERLDEQVRTGQKIVSLGALAVDLAAAGKYRLITELFPGPSDALPQDEWTPELVGVVLRANIFEGRPQDAVAIFTALKLAHLDPPSCAALVQAYLELGDIPGAQTAAKHAQQLGVTYRDLQLAILRGYRHLGHDADVEERVRIGFAQMDIPLEAPILNAFIRLRIEAGDLAGAETVLHEFRMADRTSAGVEPTVATAVLALTLHMRRYPSDGSMNVDPCVRIWNDIVDGGADVDAKSVAHLCRTLEKCGRPEDAFRILRAAVAGVVDTASAGTGVASAPATAAPPAESRWHLPADFKPDISLANVVLELSLRWRGYDGLVDVGNLMRTAEIDPDERTIITVLEFAAANLIASPIALARLLRQLLARTDVPATADQLNVIISEAIRASLRNPAAMAQYLGAPVPGVDSADIGSVALRSELRDLLASRIESLRSSKVSRSRALRTRLMYDALALGDEPAHRAIRDTWQSFVLRGYRPGATHYLSLMRAYAEAGAVKDAEDVLNIMADDGITPTPVMYAVLIAANKEAGEVARARKWYDTASRLPGGPNATLLCNMLKAYTFTGHPGDAVALARRDYAKVKVTESVVNCVAHALRLSDDVPGAIFFVAHHSKHSDTREGEGETGSPASNSSPAADLGANPASSEASEPSEPSERTTVPETVTFILTPRLRRLVRKMLLYLSQQPVDSMDSRTLAAAALAVRMVHDDGLARPDGLRRAPPLSRSARVTIVDHIAPAAKKDGVRLRYAQAAKAEEAEDEVLFEDDETEAEFKDQQ
jgi:pentatricopeptide repeat protein